MPPIMPPAPPCLWGTNKWMIRLKIWLCIWDTKKCALNANVNNVFNINNTSKIVMTTIKWWPNNNKIMVVATKIQPKKDLSLQLRKCTPNSPPAVKKWRPPQVILSSSNPSSNNCPIQKPWGSLATKSMWAIIGPPTISNIINTSNNICRITTCRCPRNSLRKTKNSRKKKTIIIATIWKALTKRRKNNNNKGNNINNNNHIPITKAIVCPEECNFRMKMKMMIKIITMKIWKKKKSILNNNKIKSIT